MTIAEALNAQERSISFREAEIFLQEVTGKERSWLHAHPEELLSDDDSEKFLSFVSRRETNEPVAYITGHKEFYGREFKTDKRALIPRPETEGLIDLTKAWAPDYFKNHSLTSNKPCPVRILELGTGCGNIAVTLGLELEALQTPAKIIATDVAPEALELAKENFALLSNNDGLSHTTFIDADMFGHQTVKQFAPYHLIVANLPYVPTTWRLDPAAQPDVIFYEPEIALFGGEDGLDHYRSFFKEAHRFLADDGKILIEYGEDETGDITPLVKTFLPDKQLIVHQDYAGLDRILEIV